jgi:phytoene desaturase
VRVAIVGAGLGGLSAACHLVGRGHDVTVLERASRPGGRAGLIEAEGYRIDPGPSVFTMPGILADTFAAAGADLHDHVRLHAVDPMYRACFPDGSELRLRHGADAMADEIERVCGAREAGAFGDFCTWLRRLYDVELPSFIDRNYDSVFDLARDRHALLELIRLGALRRLAPKVATYFEDPRLRQVFSFQSLYAGLSPYQALAVYCVITYMDTIEGVYAPEGGIHEIPQGLAAAAGKAGASFVFGEAVTRILRRPDGRVDGVQVANGEQIAADAVVCNADPAVAYRTLLGLDAPRVARRGQYSPSCVLWVAGVRGEAPAGAAHHNLHFGAEWRGSFDALLRGGTRMPDPSILVSVPTVSDTSLAPGGSSVIYALEPVPNLDGRIDWTTESPRAHEQLVARVAALGYPVDDVGVERFTDPLGWQALGHERGTPFSLAHRFFQSGPFRTPNVDARVPGLVFTGMGTVPGVGIPMALLSGRLAAARVESLDT